MGTLIDILLNVQHMLQSLTSENAHRRHFSSLFSDFPPSNKVFSGQYNYCHSKPSLFRKFKFSQPVTTKI